MNRIKIKEKAREIRDNNLKNYWVAEVLILIISALINAVVSLVSKDGSLINATLTIVTSFFISTLSVGMLSYVLKMVRKEQFSRDNLFKYVGSILPIVSIEMLTIILCFLWSILFIIPGIIAAFSYSMVFYVYIDNPDLSPYECLVKSKELMDGHKMDYFIFNLSFIGWSLLCVFIIPIVWVSPYISISQAIYYEELKNEKEK